MIAEKTKPIKIVYCYAHEDSKLRDELEKHLKILRRLREITAWFDGEIYAGIELAYETEKHLITANIILLLVSPDFFNSDILYNEQMMYALERHQAGKAHVIPILLRPVVWEGTPISSLKVLPTSEKAITLWQNRDEAFAHVVTGIREVVRALIPKEALSVEATQILFPENVVKTIQPAVVSPQITSATSSRIENTEKGLYCLECGFQNRLVAKYCVSCGQVIPIPVAPAPLSSVSSTSTEPFSLLHKRYRIRKLVGTGGMGAVYKAEDTVFGNHLVAIKEMRQINLNPQELEVATEQFKAEANMLARLTHGNLPRIFEYFMEGNRWFLVMDFIEGETLEEHLRKTPSKKLQPLEVIDIGIQICEALDYLHNRQPPVVFRDLKPSNIMLTSEGHLYLIDFGIARFFKEGKAQDTMLLGSPGYSPPEQHGRSQTSPRSDLYSLGATLHFCLTEHRSSQLFDFPPIRQFNPLFPIELDELVQQMLALNEQQRPATAREIQKRLSLIAKPSKPQPNLDFFLKNRHKL